MIFFEHRARPASDCDRAKLVGSCLAIVLLAAFTPATFAQFSTKDPRQAPELTVCSQNLENFGSYEDSRARTPAMTSQGYEEKATALVKRFATASCDVVAVQEVLGKTEAVALSALSSLAARVTKSSGRPFEARVSPEGDGAIRNGFLIALDRSEISNLISYSRMELPRLLETQKPRMFERSPLELQLHVRGKDGADDRIVTLLNIHFKSRSGAAQDPAGLQFETVRMEMAESIRRLIDLRHSSALSDPEKILVVLGDRNTDFQMAAARILDGSLALMDFREEGPCRLSKNGVPICKTDQRRPQKLFSVLTLDPETRGVAGSYYYKDQASWIDDILVPQPSLKYAVKSVFEEGNYDSGTVSKPRQASDHSLVFTRLNW